MRNPAWITGLGAVTSVGLSAATTCASIRAGLSRPSELEGHESMSYLDYAPVATTGHAAPDITRGFCAVGRWLQLAAAAVEDLCAAASLPTPEDDPGFWQQTGAYLVVPPFGVRYLLEPACDEVELPSSFRDPLLARVRSVFAPRSVVMVPKGRVGVLEVLESIEWVEARPRRIIVVATDSLVDVPSLRWLVEDRRLKCDENPVGLSPGEASVALMLEEPRSAQARGATAHAIAHAAATDLDPARTAGEGAGGIGLGRAALTVLEQGGLSEHGTSDYVADLNGEQWRARELALAQQRVGHQRFGHQRTTLPVTSTGDLGAAMSALQIAVACKALERRYSAGSSVLVTSSEPRGRVGAAVIGRAG